MKKILVLSTLLLVSVPALASVDVKESTDPNYLYNTGYSSEAIKLIQYNKAYSNGVEFRRQEQEKVKQRGFWTRFLDYVDPSRDDGKFFNRDLEMINPSKEDL